MNHNFLYVSTNISRGEVLYSGISFAEFVKYQQIPMENILLIKGDGVGNNYIKKFEAVEGRDFLNEFVKEQNYLNGEFCFVDYDTINIQNLSDQNIAELLFMAHMLKPLKIPFFDCINNRFVYLSHDDSFFCKLYVRNINDFLEVLIRKIESEVEKKYNIPFPISSGTTEKLLEISKGGLLIDFNDLKMFDNSVKIYAYSIGKYEDMDEIFNNIKYIKTHNKFVVI